MDSVVELRSEFVQIDDSNEFVRLQPAAFLVELSPDWIVRRASQNIDLLFDRPADRIIDAPLSELVQQQALHDLRNLVSRSGGGSLARAYAVRLATTGESVDLVFQVTDDGWLIEAVRSTGRFGQRFSSIGGLFAGLSESRGHGLLNGGARRMRALTGFDSVAVTAGDDRVQSDNGVEWDEEIELGPDCPVMIADTRGEPVTIVPPATASSAAAAAVLRAPGKEEAEGLDRAGIRSLLRIPFDGGEFTCACKAPRQPDFELHAAAELFAQMFAMRLRMDGLGA